VEQDTEAPSTSGRGAAAAAAAAALGAADVQLPALFIDATEQLPVNGAAEIELVDERIKRCGL